MKKNPSKRFLIVEPDRLKANQLKSEIKKFSNDVYFVTEGLEALKIASSKKPDIIFLNLNMKDLSGFEICRLLKSNFNSKVVVMADKYEISSFIRARQEGADAFITLPLQEEELKNTLKKL